MKPTVGVSLLAIGTELTRGEIANSNGAWMAERLTHLGAHVSSLETVADDATAIIDALQRLTVRNDLLLVTGGLGPTTDDITSATVAKFLGCSLVRHESVLENLRIRLLALRRDPSLLAANASQADFPKDATLIENQHGTAPGFEVMSNQCRVVCMPGVPREMRPMFEHSVAPWVSERIEDFEHVIRLSCFGEGESTLNARLAGLENTHGVTIGYRAHYPEVQIKIFSRDANPESAKSRVTAAANEARPLLSPALYSEGGQDMASTVLNLLRGRGLRLSLAESCTGGLVSSLLTAIPASDVLAGAIVSYANEVKINQLGVEAKSLQQDGAVSKTVVTQMAEGARQRLNSDLALAVTGIAGPTGATETKARGLIHFAVSTASGTQTREVTVKNRERNQTQLYAAWYGLNFLRETLLAWDLADDTNELDH